MLVVYLFTTWCFKNRILQDCISSVDLRFLLLDDFLFTILTAVPVYVEYIKNHPQALRVSIKYYFRQFWAKIYPKMSKNLALPGTLVGPLNIRPNYPRGKYLAYEISRFSKGLVPFGILGMVGGVWVSRVKLFGPTSLYPAHGFVCVCLCVFLSVCLFLSDFLCGWLITYECFLGVFLCVTVIGVCGTVCVRVCMRGRKPPDWEGMFPGGINFYPAVLLWRCFSKTSHIRKHQNWLKNMKSTVQLFIFMLSHATKA